MRVFFVGNGGEIQWCFSQVKGTVEEDVTEGLYWYYSQCKEFSKLTWVIWQVYSRFLFRILALLIT